MKYFTVTLWLLNSRQACVSKDLSSFNGTNGVGWYTAGEWNAQKTVFAQYYKPCTTSSQCGGSGNVPGTGDVVGIAVPYDTTSIQCINSFCARL